MTEPNPLEPLTDPFPGEFRLVRELGRGAFGTVWLAEDLSPLGRPVALKFVRLSGSRGLDALRHEARLLASFSHPHIVQVYAWRQPAGSGLPCLVLQYVSGGSLDAMVGRVGPLPWHLAARYVADVAEGLLALHARGIIHRDVKPANMLHEPATDEALLTDLGIAARLTDPATAAGTALFMAPEAYRGAVSPALDVFSLAASLFWLLTASHPFDGDSPAALRQAIERGLPAHNPRFSAVPALLEDLLRAGLDASPAARPTLPDFASRLRAALNLLLADRLAAGPAAPVDLRLLVSRLDHNGRAVPVVWSARAPESTPRNPHRIPPIPDRITLYSGDRVRLEVTTDRPGFVTVFNIGPTGRFNLLYPTSPRDGAARPGQAIHLLDVELTPPAGRERVVALWTEVPLTLDFAGGGQGAEYEATRRVARVQEIVNRVAAGQRHTVVLELDHRDRR